MTDLIERQKAIDALARTAIEKFNLSDEYNHYLAGLMDGELAIKNLPSAEPEQKRGRWERHNAYRGDDTSGYIDPDWRCSACGRQANVNEWFLYDLTDFCPNCGAKMEAGHE